MPSHIIFINMYAIIIPMLLVRLGHFRTYMGSVFHVRRGCSRVGTRRTEVERVGSPVGKCVFSSLFGVWMVRQRIYLT